MIIVLPWFDAQQISLLRILTDRGQSIVESQSIMRINYIWQTKDIDHSRTKARSPQTNGIANASIEP